MPALFFGPTTKEVVEESEGFTNYTQHSQLDQAPSNNFILALFFSIYIIAFVLIWAKDGVMLSDV